MVAIVGLQPQDAFRIGVEDEVHDGLIVTQFVPFQEDAEGTNWLGLPAGLAWSSGRAAGRLTRRMGTRSA
jgi:hypothetical protein